MPKCLLLFDMAYSANKISEEDKIEQIMEKLLPEYQDKLAIVRPKFLFELNEICLKLEQGMRASKVAARHIANQPNQPQQQSAKSEGDKTNDKQSKAKSRDGSKEKSKSSAKCSRL